MSKFASITSGLLARKGKARPWNQEMNEKPPLVWRPQPASAPPKDKSCSIRMSAGDFERLGILAVKRGVTRQQILKEAVAQFLASQAKTFACACLESGNPCGKDCG